MAKNTHLTLQDRSIIQNCITSQLSFKQIGAQLGKDPGTISKEVRKHREPVNTGAYGRPFNPCRHSGSCDKTFLCSRCIHGGRRCAFCNVGCYQFCNQFEEYVCPRLSSPPYVCNGCPERHRCRYRKLDYIALHAQREYESMLSESRQGISTEPEELERINGFISPLLKNGLSIHHICENNRDVVMLSERSIYNYVKAGAFDAGPLDLPRMVRMRPRRATVIKKVDRNYLVDRTFDDFLAYTADNPDLPVVEMDSVIGRKGGKVLLTLFFRETSLMLAFLRDGNDARSVQGIIDGLYTVLGQELYCKLFPIILTDRGSEFTNPLAIEADSNGELRSRVFYCDPSSPYQKGGIEVCHEMIRRVLPKGASFDGLSQADVDLMMSHINSYKREKLNNRSAHQMFSFLYGDEVLGTLGIREIPANEIVLTPKLLKK